MAGVEYWISGVNSYDRVGQVATLGIKSRPLMN